MHSQEIKLVGLKYDSNQNLTNLVKWYAGATDFESSTPTNIQYIALATSTFDSQRSNYFANVTTNIDGISENKIFKFNTNTSTYTLDTFDGFINNGSEVDLETGLIYSYSGSTDNYFINEYNPSTGISNNLGTIDFTNFVGFTLGSTCYDSNSKKYYFVVLEDNIQKLVAVNVAAQPFSYSIIPILNLNLAGNIGIQFSNETNTLFASYPIQNPNGVGSRISIGTLDPNSGVLDSVVVLPNTQYYSLGTITFDQASKSYIFVGLGSDFIEKLIVVKTDTGVIETLDLPSENIKEIKCNNATYAVNRYGALKTNSFDQTNFKLFPNPATTTLNVSNSGNLSTYTITDLLGKIILVGTINNQSNIDVSTLSKGIYVFNASQNDKIISKKLVIK